MGTARPEYDPNADPENFPLVDWADGPGTAGLSVSYMPGSDTFICFGGSAPPENPACWGHVDVQRLRLVMGLRPYVRRGAFTQTTEEAVLRYFRHEGFLRSLRPCPP